MSGRSRPERKRESEEEEPRLEETDRQEVYANVQVRVKCAGPGVAADLGVARFVARPVGI
jgi:hypothetical protein